MTNVGIRKDSNCWRSIGQAGAVLPLCVLVAFVLLLMGGLAIDTIMLGSSRAQHQHTAEYVALAALRSYGSPPSGQEIAQLSAARSRAQEIAGVNIFLSKRFQQNGSYAEDLGAGADGATGRIQPGIWHTTPTFVSGVCQGATPCPCDLSGNWSGPCFEGLDFANPADVARPVNAFHAELWLKDGSPVRTLFAKLTGQIAWSFSSRATATVKPTRGIFLVDLSKSSHSDTHIPWERGGVGYMSFDKATEYAYRLKNKSCAADEAMPCNTVSPIGSYFCSLPSVARTPTDCTFEGGWQAGATGDGFAGSIFNYDCPDIMPRVRLASFQRTRHAKLDYRCYGINSFDDDGTTVAGGNYLVDAFRGTLTGGVLYDGPEPLTTMLSTVNYAAAQLSARAVPGDLLGMIGVDQSGRIDLRTLPLSSPGSTEFSEIEEITNPSVDASTLARLTKRNTDHFFFPREVNGFNLVAGLEAAVEQLDATAGGANSESFIAVLTDGMVSCSTNSPSSCSEVDANHIQSLIDASIEFVQSQLVPRKIKFHLLLNGDIAKVSTLVRKGDTSETSERCMTETEVRQSGLSYVDYDVTHGGLTPYEALVKRPITAFYPYPLKLYQAVSATGGIYGPFRPPCLATLSPPGSTCSEGGIETLLDSECANAVSLGQPITAPASLVDAHGRLACDPRCRDQRTQGRAYVDKILDRNPYVLVE